MLNDRDIQGWGLCPCWKGLGCARGYNLRVNIADVKEYADDP